MSLSLYDGLWAAAAGIEQLDLYDMDEAPADVLAQYVERNRKAVAAAMELVVPECAVAVRYEDSFFREHVDQLTSLRHLARALVVELQWAALQHDDESAVRSGLHLLDLANATRRGGLVISMLFAGNFSLMAVERLRKHRSCLGSVARRMLIERMSRLEAERESFEAIYERDRRWEEIAATNEPKEALVEEIRDPAACGLSEEQQRATYDLVRSLMALPEPEKRDSRRDLDLASWALLRLLAVDLALRESCEMHGKSPARLSAVASLLPAEVVLDPFTHKPLLYRPQDDGSFLLYSTGPKRRDDGGRFVPWQYVLAGLGDLCLDHAEFAPPCTATTD